MRSIKFRAWDKECGEWIYAEPMYGFFPSVHGLDKSEEEYAASDHYGDVQMYTGLKDKNGKEIYEGDLLRYLPIFTHEHQEKYPWRKHGRIAGPVEWVDGWLYACRKYEGDEQLLTGKNSIVEDWEVIGNIYENPDLLKS